MTDSPTWFFTSVDAKRDHAEGGQSGSEKESSGPSDSERTDLTFTDREIQERGGVKLPGKSICEVACLLIIAVVALAWKLELRDDDRVYFKVVRDSRAITWRAEWYPIDYNLGSERHMIDGHIYDWGSLERFFVGGYPG